MWSEKDPNILYLMKRKGLQFIVSSWNRLTGKEEIITEFLVPEIGSYVEFKQFTSPGNIIVAFRETPHLFIIEVKEKNARYIKLPTRLKDAGVSKNEQIVNWANCYTYERWWMNLETGEKGLVPGFSAGHASWGQNGMVANFGGHLNIFVPADIGMTFTPGDKISVWANWKNDIVTDYGTLSADNKFVFTNGTSGDVDHQHLMISSDDPGSVMRVARYFTKFSWTSTTYSRPSPDYTKLIYNENNIGSTELQMVYTRRPDAPVNVKLSGKQITWELPERHMEIAGFNLYGSNKSGRDFVRINEKPILETRVNIDGQWKYYEVASIEHSGLESNFSTEVSHEGAKSYYFEAEEMELTPPARRFFDGYSSGFQTIRINAESADEKATPGKIRIAMNEISSGDYAVWGRVKGNGNWSVNNKSFPINQKDWNWIQLGRFNVANKNDFLDLTSSDDNLKLDMVLLTSEIFVPEALYPADGNPPFKVKNVKAVTSGRQVKLTWTASQALDIHHYSVYCGKTADFKCDNETVIRSVLKTSVTDVLPEIPKGLFYKIVAVDNRWNESEPATIQVN